MKKIVYSAFFSIVVLVFTLSCNQESAQEFNPKSSLIFEQVEYFLI
jgi:hypothetical protein